MAKAPGFWFFTGDWMKDPELRFCSIFARGLLIDLLCVCYESKHVGKFCRPDGSPRTDDEIVRAVSGGEHQEKLDALKELESSGVLSRDAAGVLFSRRMVRLGETIDYRKQAGSKGGSKKQANLVAKHVANDRQTLKQNGGVSDSDSDSDIKTHTPSQPEAETERPEPKLQLPLKAQSERNREWLGKWQEARKQKHGSRMSEISWEAESMTFAHWSEQKWYDALVFSARKASLSILDPDNDFQRLRAKRAPQTQPEAEPKRLTPISDLLKGAAQ